MEFRWYKASQHLESRMESIRMATATDSELQSVFSGGQKWMA